jgi:ParB-like chromosome segregation protein Spo0J
MQTKSKDELTSMDVPELITYVASMTAEVDHVDDKHKEALKAMEEENEKKVNDAKKASEEELKKKEAKLAAVLKAMDEKDPEKKEAMIKSAMEDDEDHKKDAKKAQEEDEEKKALKAEVTYLANKIKKPQIEFLTNVYQAANTPKEELEVYIAEWNKKNSEQLDAEIKKTQHLAETVGYSADQEKSPFGFSGAKLASGPEFSASKSLEKIDKMSPAEAFSSGGIA